MTWLVLPTKHCTCATCETLRETVDESGILRLAPRPTIKTEDGAVWGCAPYDATGHAKTCDRVQGFLLPAFYLVSDGTCGHCGNVLAWHGKP